MGNALPELEEKNTEIGFIGDEATRYKKLEERLNRSYCVSATTTHRRNPSFSGLRGYFVEHRAHQIHLTPLICSAQAYIAKRASRGKVNSIQLRLRQFTVHPEMYKLPKLETMYNLSGPKRKRLLATLQASAGTPCCGCKVSIYCLSF